MTLDLGGFVMQGGPTTSRSGISVSGTRQNLVIRHGTLRAWGLSGIDAGTAANGVFEHLRVSGNGTSNGIGLYGIRAGAQSRLVDCVAQGNVRNGLSAGAGSVFRDCMAQTNGNLGIACDAGNTLISCTAQNNFQTGISVGASCTLIGCSAIANSSYGILVTNYCVLRDCVATLNRDGGFNGDSFVGFIGCTYSNCSAGKNTGSGFTVGNGSTLTGCSATENATGFSAGRGCTVVDCTADSNNGSGIAVAEASTVRNCTARANATHGKPLESLRPMRARPLPAMSWPAPRTSASIASARFARCCCKTERGLRAGRNPAAPKKWVEESSALSEAEQRVLTESGAGR